MSSKKIALVLSGGGAKGAFQAGVLKKLDEQGYSYDVVAGVSVGALNGSMVAAGKLQELIDIWMEVRREDVYEKNGLAKLAWQFIRWKIGIGQPPQSWYRTDALAKLISEALASTDLQIPLKIGRVDLKTGHYKSQVSDHDVSLFHKEVLASGSIPVVFPPVEIGNALAVDGGIKNITPLGDVLSEDPDQVIIVPTESYSEIRPFPDAESIIDYGRATLGILLKEVFYNDIGQFLRINELVKQAATGGVTLQRSNGSPYKYFDHMLIAPRLGLGDALNFDRDLINRRFEHGYNRATEVLEAK